MKKLCLLTLAAIGLYSCDKAPEYKASPSMMNLTEGDSQKIVISPAPNADYPVEFSSANASIATVSSDGTVTAVAKGSTTIKANCSKAKFSHDVTVTVAEIVYQFLQSSVTVQLGQTHQLSILPTPPAGAFTFTSADTSVATVSSTGLVTPKKAGTVSITARHEAKNQTLTATIAVTGATYTLNYTSGHMWPGDTARLKITPTPPAGSFTFSSSNTGVATVNSTGLMTGVTPGHSTITVTITGAAAPLTCNLQIKAVTPPFLEPLLTWSLDSNAVKTQETHPFLGTATNPTNFALWFGISARDSFLSGMQYVWKAEDPATVWFINAYIPLENLADAVAYYKRHWDLKGLTSQNNIVFYNSTNTLALIVSQTADDDGDIFCQFQKLTPQASGKSVKDLKVLTSNLRKPSNGSKAITRH